MKKKERKRVEAYKVLCVSYEHVYKMFLSCQEYS